MRRRTLVLAVLALAAVASGCVTPYGGYGYGASPYYGGGSYRSGYGYYAPQRTVVVRPARVVVRRPVYYVAPPRRHPKREWVRHHHHDRRQDWRHDWRGRR